MSASWTEETQPCPGSPRSPNRPPNQRGIRLPGRRHQQPTLAASGRPDHSAGRHRGSGKHVKQNVRHPLGFTVTADCRVTAYERPHRLAIEVVSGGPIRPGVGYDLTPAGASATTVRCTVEHHPSGVARLATPVLALLHPLFGWEASSIERARRLLQPFGREPPDRLDTLVPPGGTIDDWV